MTDALIGYELGPLKSTDPPRRSRMPRQKPGKSRQDYGTPPELLAAVKKRLHIEHFSIDLAASAENTVADNFYSEEDDSLVQNWNQWRSIRGGWAWLNPPFGDIEPWVAKAANEAENGAQIVMLVPASVGSNWWSAYVEHYSYQIFLNPRLTFVGETTPYPKDCALLIYTPLALTGNECWRWK